MKTLFRLLSSLALCALCLTACQDDEFMSMPTVPTLPPSTDTRAVNATSSLVQNADGTWTATRRVPLVGQGRVVNDIYNQLISAITTTGESSMSNLVDTDLNNAATFGENVAGVQLVANQIIAVKDLDRNYAGGQTVGFTYKMGNPGLLSIDVLKGFWIKTYCDGKETGDYMIGSNEGTDVLNLNLLSTLNNDGIQSLSFKVTKEFDEIAIGFAGVDVNVLDVIGNLELYYFFVGDNEIKPAYKGSTYFPNVSLNRDHTSILFRDYGERLVDNKPDEGVTMETIISLLAGIGQIFDDTPRMTINLGQTVEAGTEIGFYIEEVNVLEVGLLNSMAFRTYDEDGNEVERITVEDNGLLGVSAIGGGKSLIGITVKKPCSQIQIRFPGVDVKIGSTTIYYAYVRDAVQADISSYFSTGEVTISGNSYHLPKPADGTVSWQIVQTPEGSAPTLNTQENKIIGMTKDGDYVLSGTYNYTDTEGKSHQQSVTFTIHRVTPELGNDCNNLIGESLEAEAYIPEGGGSLISTEHVENIGNVVNDNPNDFATYHQELSIAGNVGLIGIKLGKGHKIEANATAPKRVGFTMQTKGTFLGLNALKFFRIKLYDDAISTTDPVWDSVTGENNTVSADLIGSQGNKVRMSIVTDQSFNRMELWASGLIELDLGTGWRIYNAFYEDGSEGGACENYDASDACIEMLTTVHGAEINYKETKIGGAVNVAGSFNELGNIIDDDKDSYATISATNVLGSTTIAVKFDEMPAKSQVGFIISDPAYILNGIEALSGTKLEVFDNGRSVGSSGETTEGNVLGLDLIGYSDKYYIEVTPNYKFDEVRISFPAVANLFDIIYINGAYIRRDTDSDGIPDCAEDEENPETPVIDFTINDAEAESEHYCGTSTIRVNITDATGGEEALNEALGDVFTLVCYDAFKGGSIRQDIALDKQEKNYGFTLTDMVPGDYYISIKKEGVTLFNGVHAALHPQQTTWKGSYPSDETDWNNWSNWTDGAPWTCTNVIIPGNCTDYPVLTADAHNYCANLHIAAGGEIVNTQYLTEYDYAWVELKLQPNIYYMLSAPLKDMVTGDMFVPESWNFGNSAKNYFTALTPMTAPESRFTPRVYQRFWASEVPGKIISNGSLATEVIVSETDWTAPFNAVAEAYGMGMGFSASITGTATFRFPKEHREYTYFDGAGHSTGQTEGVARSAAVGRFWTDDMTNGNFTVTATNRAESETFVVGNPFMAHINIAKFLEANRSITAVKLYDGNSIATISGSYATETGYTHIEPMQSFYVTTTKGSSLEVTFTADMQEAKPGYQVVNAPTAQTRAETRSLTDGNTLRLTATCDSHSSTCLVRLSPSADDAYRMGEDSRLLIDTQAEPTVAVFTVADERALDIQQRRSGTDIPVGLRMKQRGRVTLTLSHQKGDDWTGWTLVDRQTGRRYPLADGYTHIDLGTTDTATGRLYLTKE